MLTYIFVFSLVGVFGMIILKVFENRRRRRVLLSNTLAQFDRSLLVYLENFRSIVEDNKTQAYGFLTEDTPRYIKYSIFVFKKTIREKYDNLLPNLRGSRILRKNGDVSSFLKDIARHKKESLPGKIEDDSLS